MTDMKRIRELVKRAATLTYRDQHIHEATDRYFPNRQRGKDERKKPPPVKERLVVISFPFLLVIDRLFSQVLPDKALHDLLHTGVIVQAPAFEQPPEAVG